MLRVKNIIWPILISIACLATTDSYAQQQQNEEKSDQYRAVQWTIEDSLPSDLSNTLFKDTQGFLWIGSGSGEGGLCRFDGKAFKKYIPHPQKRGTINSETIFTFKEDSLHNIWIGTNKGLSRYDIKTDTFTNFPPYIDSAFQKLYIAPFGATRDEVFCLEPGSLITAFNIHTLTRRKLVEVSKEVDMGIHWNANKCFFDKVSNSVWKLTFYGAQGVLEQIFLGNGKSQKYSWPCTRGIAIHQHNAEDMQYDAIRNSIWINSGDGLLEFSLADKKFHPIDALKEFVKLNEYDRWVGIDLDKNGRVWLATKPKGILIYDPKTEQVQPLFSDPVLKEKTAEANLHIYCDRDGIVWTSYWARKGIYALLPFTSSVKRYTANPGRKDSLSNSWVSSIVLGGQGKLWMGTSDGVNIFDPASEKFEVLREKDLPGIKGKSIVPLYIDTLRQKAWINAGSQETLDPYSGMDMYEMDLLTKICQPIVFGDGSKKLDTLVYVPSEIIPFKNGFLVEDDNHGVFEIKAGSLIANLVIPFDKPVSIDEVVLEEERLLFLRRYESLPNFSYENKNGKWVKVPHLLDTLEWINMLFNEKDKTHWVSFKYELVHYDKEFRKIKSYGREEGYNSSIFNMLIDDAGNLWYINVLKQVCRLNISTGIISALSEANGFFRKDYFWDVPVAKDLLGNLYFGTGFNKLAGTGGLDRIFPENYLTVSTSLVYYRSLAINQKPFALPVGLTSLEELSLDHDQNTIKIETGIIDYYSNGEGNIRYKLEGDGKALDWQYPTDNIIRYERLQPGTYRLVIQATGNVNEFNSPEKVLVLTINPPFWQTWWFRILTAAAVILILSGIIQYRSRSLMQQKVALEEKVMLRTNELKHSLEELKATQSQLVQSEKMASLGELTAGIAHEIQNPLNFVNNFSEVSNELIDEMKDELKKGNYDEVNIIANDVKQNLEKINHHGKRADAIVKGMLQHSRSSTGIKEPTNINALADEYLRLAYHGLRAKDKSFNATMRTDFDESIGSINIIPQDIGRVILNLINNAFYALSAKVSAFANASAGNETTADKYEPTVWVSTKKTNGTIEISVKDNGNGIPPKVLDKIFQPFFTTKPTGEGTGLGLSLAYDIITKGHGGELKLANKEGEGAEFIIHLPVK